MTETKTPPNAWSKQINLVSVFGGKIEPVHCVTPTHSGASIALQHDGPVPGRINYKNGYFELCAGHMLYVFTPIEIGRLVIGHAPIRKKNLVVAINYGHVVFGLNGEDMSSYHIPIASLRGFAKVAFPDINGAYCEHESQETCFLTTGKMCCKPHSTPSRSVMRYL